MSSVSSLPAGLPPGSELSGACLGDVGADVVTSCPSCAVWVMDCCGDDVRAGGCAGAPSWGRGRPRSTGHTRARSCRLTSPRTAAIFLSCATSCVMWITIYITTTWIKARISMWIQCPLMEFVQLQIAAHTSHQCILIQRALFRHQGLVSCIGLLCCAQTHA